MADFWDSESASCSSGIDCGIGMVADEGEKIRLCSYSCRIYDRNNKSLNK
ncbi:hypothetical protein ES707_17092 [subsurface metagenome]